MKVKLSEVRAMIRSALAEAPRGVTGGRYNRQEDIRRMNSARLRRVEGIISLPTVSAIALWKDEITGQLSDGMWENSKPYEHWVFWSNMKPVLGRPGVKATDAPLKSSYNLSALVEYVGDRMLQVGKMARAVNNPNADREVFHAAQYMPATFDEFMKSKETGKWAYDYVAKYMTDVTPEIAQKYYATSYTDKDLSRDLSLIKMAMKNVQIVHDSAKHTPDPIPELPPAVPGSPSGEKLYKIYGKKGSSPAHTRYKGKAYVAKIDTQFGSGDQADVSPEGSKLKVKRPDSDYSQLWEPED